MSDFDVLGAVGKLALPNFCKVPDLRESELGFVRYDPANRGHRSVFGPFEDSFPIGIPARPGKILAIREFHVVHECVFFPTCSGLHKRGNVGGKVPEFSAQPYFVGLFSRAGPCTEASLGSQDMILRTEAVGKFLMPRVLTITRSFLVRFRPVKYRIEALIMLSAWSTVRSNLGQTWSTLVNLGKTWSDFGKCAPDHVLRLFDVAGLRQIRPAWNVGQRINDSIFARSDFLGFLTAVAQFVSVRVPVLPGSKWAFQGLEKIGRDAKRRTQIDDQFSPTRPTGKHLSIPTFLFSFERSD
uniref:Uncharacterized protein n=1 Tax=Fagus sylvatica TaxID=28930 RepID=A0A2N9GEB6_FAGSY